MNKTVIQPAFSKFQNQNSNQIDQECQDLSEEFNPKCYIMSKRQKKKENQLLKQEINGKKLDQFRQSQWKKNYLKKSISIIDLPT